MAGGRVSTRAVLTGAATGLLLTLGCGLAPAGADTPADAQFTPGECAVEIPAEHRDRVTCGTLVVPEQRGTGADGKSIRLPVAIIASSSEDPAADPMVFPTAGGPGGGSFNRLEWLLDTTAWVTEERDFIIMEQRGDSFAQPALTCPELDADEFIEGGRVLRDDAYEERYWHQVQACHDRLVGDGVDLSAYTTGASVLDLVDLRSVLGYDEWNLWGSSYGTRLALAVMRDHPAGLRAVILDGAYPPHVRAYEDRPAGFTAAVDKLLSDCAADPDCNQRHPDLESDLLDVLDRAAQSPIVMSVKHPLDGTPVRTEIDGGGLAGGLYDALYDPWSIRALPFLVGQAADGNTDAMLPLAQNDLYSTNWQTEGLFRAIDCAEEAPFDDDDAIEGAHAASPLAAHLSYDTAETRRLCDLWDVPTMPATGKALVRSDVPALITVGGYDPVTPQAMSEAAAEGLLNHHLHVFPTMGHGVVWSAEECPVSIARQFLADPMAMQDASCIAAMAPIDFMTTTDVIPTTAVYRLDSDVIQERQPLQVAILAGTLLVQVATLVYGAVAAVVGLRRLSRLPPATTRRLSRPQLGSRAGLVETLLATAVLASVLNLAFAVGLVMVLTRTDQLILGFGLPTGARPLLWLPWLALVATLVLVVLLVRGRHADGPRWHRAALWTSAVGSLAFAGWLLSRGLLLV